MTFSFQFTWKSQPERKKFDFEADGLLTKPAAAPPSFSTRNYHREFSPPETPRQIEAKIKSIAPLPNEWRRPLKKLRETTNTDGSMRYGLNVRQPPAARETISELESRILREDLDKLPEDPGMEDFLEVPVEGFGLALLSGYGWKPGMGIGRNAKEDVEINEVVKKNGRGGIGFNSDDEGAWNFGNANAEQDQKEKKRIHLREKVRIVSGREMGMKGEVIQVKGDDESLVLRLSQNRKKVKVRSHDVAELGSVAEKKCLKELKIKKQKEHRNSSRKTGQEVKRLVDASQSWLRSQIRVRFINTDLKGGRLFLKNGVVVDVVAPGTCDIFMDESRELIQGVGQECLDTALPRCQAPVLVLCGRYKGVYGSLLPCDSEKETSLVCDANTYEMLNVRLDQIAEYTGDPSDIGY